MRALWNPVPAFKTLIFGLYEAVQRFGCYYAVHLRRGDKLSTHEMRHISAGMYYQSVMNTCRQQSAMCCTNLFVVYDDRKLYNEFHQMSAKKFRVFDLGKLLAMEKKSRYDYTIELNGMNVYDVLKDNQSQWFIHTREVIVSITLLSLADHVFCTFSSNFCRVVALLRGNRCGFDTLHSLDTSWHKSLE
ncbi:uncharacterized protein LOC129587413 [Paramacrobiotus metropolitanus]|uniref:uncharacterized protein LOC129587413 n=1 Tax=Paramacrobiotus metropolitanus TaxID=2943436 RepID=UPI0024459BD6|nr:uncharacterized protein LOC129587413 [Paramacrobiotus metropolitanus]